MSNRRSLARPQDGPPSGEALDVTAELRMRRSFARTPLQPFAQRESLAPNRRLSHVSPAAVGTNPTVFFNCLKLAAENKITTKNAFNLAMIDYLSEAVQCRESPLNNFQLAGCSLDAGTKIYAARVDHVAGNLAQFAMSMQMMHKKGANNADVDDNQDEDNNEGEEKKTKKKKKKRVRSTVLARDASENTLDMSKMVPRNKLFPIVGNMMDESLDSFTFTERSRNGAVSEMRREALESLPENAPVKISVPKLIKLPGQPLSLVPSLSDFKFTLPSMTSTVRSHKESIRPGSPRKSTCRITLTRDNFDHDDAGFDDDVPNFDDNTVVEEVAACAARQVEHVGGVEDDTLFTAQLPALHPSMYYLTDKDNLPRLYGPDYWKYKKPVVRTAPTAPSTQRKVVEVLPIDFDAVIDMTKLEKSKEKTYLSRETMVRWNKDRHVLPCETDDEVAMLSQRPEEPNILDVGLCYPLRIPDPRLPRGHHVDKTPSRNVPYNYDNEVDKENYCPFPQEPMILSDDDDDYNADDLLDNGEDFNNLFSQADTQDVSTREMADMFRESMLVPLPANAVNTVAPVWKAARGVNMRQLEALMWKQLENDIGVEGGDKENKSFEEKPVEPSKAWKFSELRKNLPVKITSNCSVTTQLYALLNLANKKGLDIVGNAAHTDLKVRCLREKKDKPKDGRTHPALLGF